MSINNADISESIATFCAALRFCSAKDSVGVRSIPLNRADVDHLREALMKFRQKGTISL